MWPRSQNRSIGMMSPGRSPARFEARMAGARDDRKGRPEHRLVIHPVREIGGRDQGDIDLVAVQRVDIVVGHEIDQLYTHAGRPLGDLFREPRHQHLGEEIAAGQFESGVAGRRIEILRAAEKRLKLVEDFAQRDRQRARIIRRFEPLAAADETIRRPGRGAGGPAPPRRRAATSPMRAPARTVEPSRRSASSTRSRLRSKVAIFMATNIYGYDQTIYQI